MRQKRSRKNYFNSTRIKHFQKPLPERGAALLLELYSIWKEHSWHWKTGICVQTEKVLFQITSCTQKQKGTSLHQCAHQCCLVHSKLHFCQRIDVA